MFKSARSRLRAAVFACAAAFGLGAYAADYTGTDYAPWSYSAGCVVWRGTSSQLFHKSTIADVAADGTIGSPYDLDTTGHPWQAFASNGGSNYTAPGLTLVFDEAGYNGSSDAQFAPLSFGGLWVKVLQADDTPYCITDSKTDNTDRTVELGAADTSTYFKFEKSFTFNRNSATKVIGTATVDIDSGATFTINARANKGAVVESGNTLVLAGSGTLAVTGGLTIGGTLDISAASVPTISGDVTLSAGCTIVLPASAELNTAISIPVATTVTAGSIIWAKIGANDAVRVVPTVESGAITYLDTNVEFTYYSTDAYPTTIPDDGCIYNFVGGESANAATTFAGVTVNGILKTRGYVNLTDFTLNVGGTHEVVSETTTVTAAWNSTDNYGYVSGNITIDAGATYAVTQTDTINWANSGVQKINIYGTLALGTHRWSIMGVDHCVFNLYPGARITGTGDANGLLDLFATTSKLNCYAGSAGGGDIYVEGRLKTRNANTPIWVAANTTLHLQGGLTGDDRTSGGIAKSGAGTLELSGAVASTVTNSSVTDGTFALVDATGTALPLTVNANKRVTVSASSGVTVPLNVTMAGGSSITVAGAGTVNGTVTMNALPGTTTDLTAASWAGTVSLAALSNPANVSVLQKLGSENSTLVLKGISSSAYIAASGNTTYTIACPIRLDGAVVIDNGSSGSTINLGKISGTGNLTIAEWNGCSSIRYNLNAIDIDNYSGTLTLANNNLRTAGGTMTIGIGNLINASAAVGSVVLPITTTAVDNTTGTIAYNFASGALNGTTTNLCYDTVSEVSGIFIAAAKIGTTGYATVQNAIDALGNDPADEQLATISVVDANATIPDGYKVENGVISKDVVSTVTITVPTVANASVVVSDGTTTYTPTTEGGTTYSVPAGANITATYTATEGYELEGTSSYVLTNVAEGDAVTITDTEAKPYVAQFNNVKHTTVQGAINAWAAVADAGTAYSQVSLLGDVTESSVEIPVGAADMPCQINGGGHTLTAPVTIAKGACLSPTALTIAGNLTVNGTYYRIGPEAIAVSGALTFGDDATIAVTALSNETSVFAATGAVTISGDLNVLLYSKTLTAGEYTIATGASVTRAADSQVVVTLNETVTDTWALSNTKTAVVLTGAAARVNGDTYPTFTEAVTAANGTETIELLAAASYTLTEGETVIVKAGSLTFTVSAPQGYVISETTVSDGVVSYTTDSALVRTTKEVYESGAWRTVDGYPKEYASIVAAIADITLAPVENSTRYTVTMLGNETLATRAEPNYSMTIDLGGYTLTREGTSGNGSVFDVKSGTVTIKNGTIDCTQDDAAIVADGVYAITARSGSVVTLEGLTITVDSQAGACVYPFEGATVTIKSGTYKNETAEEYQYKTGWTGMAVNQANVATRLLIIEGGKFSQVNPEEGDDSGNVTNFLAAGRIAKLADGYWVVSAGTWVAEVGGTKFESLAEAVTAAESGATVTLLADVTLDSTVVVTNSLTLDLNGHDIAATDARALWIKAGTVSITGEGVVSANGNGLGETSSVIRVGDGATNANAAGLTIGASVAVESAKCYGVTAFGNNTPGITLVVNGTVAVTSSGEADAAISGNGSPGLAETYITINSGATVTSANSAAIYNPGAGTLTVNGGTITGKHGIVARAGSVAVNGGTITATGTAQDAETIGDSANVIPCAAIAYDAGANYPGFDDGTAIAVTGGTFTSNVDSIDTTGEPTVAVSGGEFSSAVPAEYCAEGYEPKDNGDGTYGVREDKGWVYSAPGYWNYTGTWSDGVTLGDEKVTIEDGATYTAAKASDGQFVTVAMTLSFDDVNDDDSDFGDAKAAIRLAAGETDGTYQFQLYTSDGENKVWTNATVEIEATKEEDYNFVFVLDLTNKTYTASIVSGATTNVLSIGESITAIPFACQGEVTPVQTIDFVGSGTVSSIEGSYEDPEGFVADEMIGNVTLTAAQAEWLNGQGNYDALAAKIATMSQTALDNAYLLNLNIAGDFSYEFGVSDFKVDTAAGTATVYVTLTRTGALAENEVAKPIIGTLKLTGTAEIGTAFAEIGSADLTFDANAGFGNGATTTAVTVDIGENGTGAKFYLPVIE